MCWGVLYTEDNDANTNSDDDAAQLHLLSWPLAISVKNSACKTAYRHTDAHTDREMTICYSIGSNLVKQKSTNNPNSVLSRLPHPPKGKIAQNQSLQHTTSSEDKNYPKINAFKTTASCQSENGWKSFL